MRENAGKPMVSYWEDVQEVYKTEQGFVIIRGFYDEKCIGIHWASEFPSSRGVLTPCVIPKEVACAMLAGLIQQAINIGDNQRLKALQEAYHYITH